MHAHKPSEAGHRRGAEVVVADRSGATRLVAVTREAVDAERDRRWAYTSGGGGSFGVVIRYLLRNPEEMSTAR